MKKTTKGAIAAGSAALLLAGGAGTMAAWNASGNLAGGTVNAGELSLTAAPGGTGQWQLKGAAYTDQLLVPGDVLTYTANYTIAAKGTNLKATLKANDLTFTAASGTELKSKLATTVTAKIDNAVVTDITPLNGDGKVVNVVASIVFDGTTNELVAQNQSATFNAPTITLEQTAVTP